MNFKNFIFAIVAVGMLATAVGTILSEWDVAYNSNVSSDLTELNTIDDISGYAEEYKGQINPESGEASSDAESETFKGAYGIITYITQPFRLVFGENGMLALLGERFGVPRWVTKGFVSMVIFAIIFTIIAIIFRSPRPSV